MESASQKRWAGGGCLKMPVAGRVNKLTWKKYLEKDETC